MENAETLGCEGDEKSPRNRPKEERIPPSVISLTETGGQKNERQERQNRWHEMLRVTAGGWRLNDSGAVAILAWLSKHATRSSCRKNIESVIDKIGILYSKEASTDICMVPSSSTRKSSTYA